MTIPVSTAPTVKALLVSLLTSNLTADGSFGLTVVNSQPGTYLPPDIVAVGDISRTVQPLAMVGGGGPGARVENYTVTITVSVFRTAPDPTPAEVRWYGLVGQVEQAVRTDPSLGGLVVEAWPAASDSHAAASEDHKGWLCEGTVTVAVTATL